jgi:hypothetical protein
MVRYVADQNQVAFSYESGTYAVASGTMQWAGLVQDHSLTTSVNTNAIRFTGNDSRDVGQQVNVMEDYEGTISYYPQDWKFLAFALGSVVDSGSPSPYAHTIVGADSGDGNQFTSGTLSPFISFTVEDTHVSAGSATSNTNFKRTANGCMVDSYTITATNGEPISCEVSYIAQNVVQSSGAPTAITAATTRPFLFGDVVVKKAAATLETVREASFTINNNLDAPHYTNGSVVVREPIPGNRDYELSLSMDSNDTDVITFYEVNYKGGSVFNASYVFTATDAGTGSRDATITFSGCKITSMDNPTTMEGVNEVSMTIVPNLVKAVINDEIELYGAW